MRTFAIVWLKWSHLSGQCTTTTPSVLSFSDSPPHCHTQECHHHALYPPTRSGPVSSVSAAGVNVCLCTHSVARLSHGWITICPPSPQHTSSPSGTMDTVLNYFIDDSSSVTLFPTFFFFFFFTVATPSPSSCPPHPPTPRQLG